VWETEVLLCVDSGSFNVTEILLLCFSWKHTWMRDLYSKHLSRWEKLLSELNWSATSSPGEVHLLIYFSRPQCGPYRVNRYIQMKYTAEEEHFLKRHVCIVCTVCQLCLSELKLPIAG